MADDLLSIGQFARLSGLSVGALRRYRTEQLETARVIARLRERHRRARRVEGAGGAELPRIKDAEDRQILEQDLATLP